MIIWQIGTQDVRCLLSTHVIQFKIESIHLYYIWVEPSVDNMFSERFYIGFSSNCAPLCRRGSCSRVVRVSMPIPGQKHAAHVVNNLLMAPVQLPRHVKRLWGPCATLPLPFFFLLSPPPSIGLSEYLTSEFYSFQFNSDEHSANVC